MGKSIRSKREKRLRTQRRDIATEHYNKMQDAKDAVMDAALAAPKVVDPRREAEMGDDAELLERGRSRPTSMEGVEAMAVDSGAPTRAAGALKPVKILFKKSRRQLRAEKKRGASKGPEKGHGGKNRKKKNFFVLHKKRSHT